METERYQENLVDLIKMISLNLTKPFIVILFIVCRYRIFSFWFSIYLATKDDRSKSYQISRLSFIIRL